MRGVLPGDEFLALEFSGPRKTYERLQDETSNAYAAFLGAATALMPRSYQGIRVRARAQVSKPPKQSWRDDALAMVEGRAIDNQAIGFKAPKSYEGLRFRSESEVRIAQALDRMRVMYLPNCRGRVGTGPETRKSVEADFIVFLNGKWGVLEVDGEPFHPAERSAMEHERDRAYKRHGAQVVERFDAERCFKNPDQVVAQFLTLLKGQ